MDESQVTRRTDDHDRRQRQQREANALATTTADDRARRATIHNGPLDYDHGNDSDRSVRMPTTTNDVWEDVK